MRIFITGHKGQLGKVLRTSLVAEGHTLLGGDLPEWEMTDAEQVMESLQVFSPDVVIHSAALTNVDYCAENPEEAVRINGVGTYNVALACREVDALLVAISTNEVFDGRAKRPYQEYDQCNPVNPYGYSKYVAEQVVERLAPRYMIVRTAWLYASGGVNFIHKIIARARSGSRLRVVTDEVSSPTYVNDLAAALLDLLEVGRPGIYHLTNAGECSRYHFAQEILRLIGLDVSIEPISLDDFVRPSMPPAYAPLANVFGAAAGIELRPWQEALAEYVAQYEAQ
ncbi:MAG: dTDP-4-dehydrorhamnose reductase [Anaerolineae bacterium]|nr:dTDP-4-dehydrorhamnose reductase [Anaerolineae bacterium]